MNGQEIVRTLKPADAPVAATVLAQAFIQEPAKLVILPDTKIRRTFLESIVSVRLYDALRCGWAHGAQLDGELAAVALWYPPGVSLLSLGGAARGALTVFSVLGSLARAFPRMTRTLLSDLPGFVSMIRERRPAVALATQGLTWRLDLLGTLPEYRGQGLARALLERQLQRCDQDGAAVWLEATDPVNPPFYERFGFETVVHIDGPNWLPGYWVMRREPGM